MKLLFFSAFIFCGSICFSQESYWQQYLKYTINVSLNEVEKSLTGNESLVYKNNSPQSLDFIWFHIWPNAYKDENTALFQQIMHDPDRKDKMQRHKSGYIEQLAFKVNGLNANTQPHPNPAYTDIIKLLLPSALKPGESIIITTPFKVQLPSYFSRSGYADGEFMACQWYPKPAVFDRSGWHEFPYLDMGEFYSDYASYNVNITLPAAYVVAATGVLQNRDELALYKETGSMNTRDKGSKGNLYKPAGAALIKTLSYMADTVPDFAWFADKEFIIQYDTVLLPGGKAIDAFTWYHNRKKTTWSNSIGFVKDAVKHYSTWIGEYAYPVVQAVEGPKNNVSGGMEYPMITLITSPDSKPETLDAVITHEVGHNWFMSMLGSNERLHTWMDEGLNSYFEFRYEAEKYRSNTVMGNSLPDQVKKMNAGDFQDNVYNMLSTIKMTTPIETPAAMFESSQEYGIVSYVKTAVWMYMLEKSVGKEKVDLAFRHYFEKWKNKHPQPDDMKAAFEESLNAKLDEFFKLLNKEGNL